MTNLRLLCRRAPVTCAAAWVAATLTVSGPAAQAAGPDSCAQLVTDSAAAVDDARLATAAAQVQRATAADIRIRVFSSVPDANLDAAIDRLRHDCRTWQDLDGGAKNNMIVLALSVDDRRSGLYYGDTFAGRLDDNWTRIQAGYLNPKFRSGDYTGGLLAGLREVGHVLDPTYAPEHPADGTPDNPGYSPGTPGSGTPGYADHSTGAGSVDVAWGWVLGVPGGILLLGGGGYGTVLLRRRLRDRDAARLAAAQARDEMMAAFMELDQVSNFTGSRTAALPHVEDRGVQAAHHLEELAQAASAPVTTAYLAAEEANQPDRLGTLDTAAAHAAAAAMSAVTAQLRDATADWNRVEAQVSSLEALRTELPGQLDHVDTLLAATRALAPQRAAAGFRVETYTTRADADAREVTEVRALLDQMRFGDADGRADAVLASAQSTHDELDRLPTWQTSLRSDLDRLTAARTAAEADLAAASRLADDLGGTYHRECVAGLSETLDGVRTTLAALDDVLSDLDDSSSMGQQRFAAAAACVTRADQLLAQVSAGTAAPQARSDELRTLAAALPARAQAAARAVAALVATAAAHRDALSYLTDPADTATLAAGFAGVLADLGDSRPALLTLRETTTDLEADLEGARGRTESAIAEYDRVQRQLSSAASAIRDAQSQASRSHAGSHAKDLVRQAETALANARAAGTLAEQSAKAGRAKTLADDAESAARTAIRAHEQAEARRRAQAASASSGLGSGPHHGGSSFGGGSSSFDGGGGGTGFGGGSSSF